MLQNGEVVIHIFTLRKRGGEGEFISKSHVSECILPNTIVDSNHHTKSCCYYVALLPEFRCVQGDTTPNMGVKRS
jgi:hypothetical protein